MGALGPVITGDPAFFDRGGLTPDVNVLFADGRYHMAYDWATPDWPLLGNMDAPPSWALYAQTAPSPEGP